jgi:NhaA family Na+:H+ antiporter
VALGIMAGLFFGKQIGVFSLSWIAIKLGLATLPEDLKLTHIYGGGILSGIGFTMSLFISGLAFTDPILNELSKMSILLASLAAATYGYAVLRFVAPQTGSTEEEAAAPTVPAAHAGESFG